MKIDVYFDGLTQTPTLLQDSNALKKLLAIGNTQLKTADLQVQCCERFKLPNNGDYPIAAMMHHANNHSSVNHEVLHNQSVADYYLLAHPVHLTLQRDFFSMDAPAPLALRIDEANNLSEAFNAHFAEEGLVFVFLGEKIWLIVSTQPCQLTTSPVSQVVGHDTRRFLPYGKDAAWAARLSNEIQMLLFEHPVNQAREQRGELPVNSLWMSGTGRLPASVSALDMQVYSDNLLLIGCAKLSQTPYFSAPKKISDVIKIQKNALIWLDVMATEQAPGGQDWFEEILILLKLKKVQQMSLHIQLMNKLLSITLTPADLWKFWRKEKPIMSYFEDIHG